MVAVITPASGFHEGYFAVGDDDAIYLDTSSGAIPVSGSDASAVTLTRIGMDWFYYGNSTVFIIPPTSPAAIGNTVFEGSVAGIYHGESETMFIGLGIGTVQARSALTPAEQIAARAGISLAPPGASVAVGPYNGTTKLAVYRQIKRGLWERMRYDNDDSSQCLSRRAVHLFPTFALYRAKDMTQTGTLGATLTTSTSGSNAKYIGNTAIASSTAGSKRSLTITPLDDLPYDVYVAVTLRTSGGFLKPTIDGDQTLLSSDIVDPQSLGFKAINCYGPVDNTRRQLTKIASGLTGSHTVELECVAGVPTGSSAGSTGAVTVECVLATSELSDPKTRPLRWAQGQTIAAGDEREYGGRFYCATTAGTTGATPPTHTSSTASDGGVTWSAAGAIYASNWVQIRDIDYASEVESAIVSLVYSATTYDVGGQTHGNEFQSNRVITLDGAPYTWSGDASDIQFGSRVEISEDIAWKTSAGGTVLASGTRRTVVTGAGATNRKELTTPPGISFTIASGYIAMAPFVRWDGFWQRSAFTTLLKPDGTSYSFDDYPTDTDQDLGTVKSFAIAGDMGISGQVVYAVSVPEDAPVVSTWCRMNIVPVTPPPSGSTDWQAKAYITRALTTPETISAGQTLIFENTHEIRAS